MKTSYTWSHDKQRDHSSDDLNTQFIINNGDKL